MSYLLGVIVDVQESDSEQKETEVVMSSRSNSISLNKIKRNREKKCNKIAIISVVKLYFWYNLSVCKEKEINKKIINLSLL